MTRKSDKKHPGQPTWLLTFSDMMLLLLTFFVVLLSMTQMDQTRFHEAAGSLRGAFGVLERTDKIEDKYLQVLPADPVYDDFTSRVYQRIMTHLNRLQLNRDVILVRDRGSLVLRINDAILFEDDSAEIRKEAYPVLRKIALLVRPLPLDLRIEGHVDLPGQGASSSDVWDLSLQRSARVLRVFAEDNLLSPDRLSAAGYGATRPLVPPGSSGDRALNNRVEFFLENLGGSKDRLPYLIDAGEQLPF